MGCIDDSDENIINQWFEIKKSTFSLFSRSITF